MYGAYVCRQHQGRILEMNVNTLTEISRACTYLVRNHIGSSKAPPSHDRVIETVENDPCGAVGSQLAPVIACNTNAVRPDT